MNGAGPAPGAPPGFGYLECFLSLAEEQVLAAAIDAHEAGRWRHVVLRGQASRRRVSDYGLAYVAASRGLVPTLPVPEYLRETRARCAAAAGLEAEELAQVIVTDYPSGAGINPHVDAPIFGEPVVGVSLRAPAVFTFRRGEGTYRTVVRARSLYLLGGEARWLWTHEVRPVRERRLSITLRRVPALGPEEGRDAASRGRAGRAHPAEPTHAAPGEGGAS